MLTTTMSVRSSTTKSRLLATGVCSVAICWKSTQLCRLTTASIRQSVGLCRIKASSPTNMYGPPCNAIPLPNWCELKCYSPDPSFFFFSFFFDWTPVGLREMGTRPSASLSGGQARPLSNLPPKRDHRHLCVLYTGYPKVTLQ